MGKKAAGGYYAVGNGRQVGIFNSWDECQAQVKGFPNAKFKKFGSEQEAQQFVQQHQTNIKPRQPAVSLPIQTQVPSQSRPQAFSGGPYQPRQPAHSLPTQSQHSSNSFETSQKRPCSSSSSDAAGHGISQEGKLQELIMKSKRDAERVGQTKLLASPLPNMNLKRTRVDSPNIKGMQTAAGDKIFLPFLVDDEDYVHVHTDGSCPDNGRTNPRAGIGVWFGDDHPLNVSEPVEGPATNNNAEIQAAAKAIELARQAGFSKLRVNTDSDFLIKSMTQYIHKWKDNGWKLASGGDVKNRTEFEKLDRAQQGITVEWVKVLGHSGIHGNEQADKLANDGARRYMQA